MVISRSSLLRMRNISDEFCSENEDTRFMLNTFFLEYHTFYEIMWKKSVELDRPQMTIWRMRIASWMPNDTNTYSEYITLIAFLLEQWLHERAFMLPCTYIACIFVIGEFNCVSDSRI